MIVEPLHILKEETESIPESPLCVCHFKAISKDELEFEKPGIRIFKMFNSEESIEFYVIETFTELGLWKENPDIIEGIIPHPFVQHIHRLGLLDHIPDGCIS